MIVDTKTGEYKISKQIRKKYSVDYDGSLDFKKRNKKNFDKENWLFINKSLFIFLNHRQSLYRNQSSVYNINKHYFKNENTFNARTEMGGRKIPIYYFSILIRIHQVARVLILVGINVPFWKKQLTLGPGLLSSKY